MPPSCIILLSLATAAWRCCRGDGTGVRRLGEALVERPLGVGVVERGTGVGGGGWEGRSNGDLRPSTRWFKADVSDSLEL